MVNFSREDWANLNAPYYKYESFGTPLSDGSTVLTKVGKKDILIYCTNSVKRRVGGKILLPSLYLGAMAETIAERANCSCITQRSFPKGSLNEPDSEFYLKSKELIKNTNTTLVIMLNGLKGDRGDIVQIGTNFGELCDNSVEDGLRQILTEYRIEYVIDEGYFDSTRMSVRNLSTEFLNVNFIQIGIPRCYRDCGNKPELANLFVNMIIDYVTWI